MATILNLKTSVDDMTKAGESMRAAKTSAESLNAIMEAIDKTAKVVREIAERFDSIKPANFQ